MPGNTHSFRKKENMGMLEFMHETLSNTQKKHKHSLRTPLD